jgi:voltage-gated potassium channel
MADDASVSPSSPDREPGARGLVRFYLLDHRTWIGKSVDVSLLALNVAFVAVFAAETYPLGARTVASLRTAEAAIAVVFLAEYCLRVYGARDRLAEATDPYAVVDLVAVLPTLVALVAPVSGAAGGLGALRAIRVVRVLRFYRFTRDADFFFGTITDNGLRALKLLLTVLVVLFVTAGLFYGAEHAANPDVATFGDAFYYAVVTLSTVGFGDVLPVTAAGRWVTVAAILAAIIVIPRQASRIVREWTTADRRDVTCPACGLVGHDADASHCKACGAVIYQEYDDSADGAG